MNVGDKVFNERYGFGIILRDNGSDTVTVKFENNDSKYLLKTSSLKIIEAKKQENYEEETNKKSSEKNISVSLEDKADYNAPFYSKIESSVCSMLSKASPSIVLKYGTTFCAIPFPNIDNRLGILFFHDAVLAFLIDSTFNIDNFSCIENEIGKLIEKSEQVLRSRLMESLALRANNGLCFQFKFVVVFTNFKDTKSISCGSIFDANLENCNGRKLYNIFGNAESFFDEYKRTAILERLLTEYTTIGKAISYKKSEEVPENYGFPKNISANDLNLSSFALDEYQISLINKMKYGHYLFLANPGTGKSVLLLSKAYRLTNLYKKGIVLITCKNKNLENIYEKRSFLSGFWSRENLEISTFDKLVINILDANSISQSFSENRYEENLDSLYNALRSNRIRTKFKAIFVDEVQLFNSKMLDSLYLMLENPETSFFELYGDINQDVKSEKRDFMSPWRGTLCLPKFTGRTYKLQKNYRNTIEIGEYLNSIHDKIVEDLQYLGTKIVAEDYNIDSHCFRKGVKPIVYETKRDNFVYYLDKAIQSIKKEGLDYNDIAIIFPKQSFIQKKYYPLQWIEDYLNKKNIPCSRIFGKDFTKKKLISNADGIIISTIESSLGLDFKAVIVCGLYEYDYCFDSRNGKTVMFELPSICAIKNTPNNWIFVSSFSQYAKQFYTAASRARDFLYIICDSENISFKDDFILMGDK